MVRIEKRTVSGQTFFYLEHSFRKDGLVQKKELYLGKQIPKNIEELKKNFLFEIYGERWFKLFGKIKKNFSSEQKKMPLSAKEKEIESFMVKFTYNTNRIEGSTLTFKETANLLERGITPKEKPIRDVKEAETHKEVFYEMVNYKKDLNFQTVLYWHKKLFSATKRDIAGKIREHNVAISGSKFVPPHAVEVYSLLIDFFKWYEKNKNNLHPVQLAALVHLKFVTIHPFSDGNGRMSRLLMNFILNKHGYPMLVVPYESRSSYYTALERTQIKKDESIFLNWFFKRYLKEFVEYSK